MNHSYTLPVFLGYFEEKYRFFYTSTYKIEKNKYILTGKRVFCSSVSSICDY